MTPKGTALEGVYNENYCTFYIEQKTDEELPQLLDRVVIDLSQYKNLFRSIRDEGGSAEFFIGWFTENNSGEIFDYRLMQKLAELKIDLALDVYGGEEHQTKSL
jgi:hypothetical protein